MFQASANTVFVSFIVEGFFLGMNCVLYSFCAYTLWGQKSVSCRLLLFINTVQFLLCVLQSILHTVFIFTVFTVASDIQLYLQHVSPYLFGYTVIFGINFITGASLSIWRLYVLYDNDFRVCIPASIVWIAQICSTALTLRVYATIPVASTTFSPVEMLLWALITTLNIFVAIPSSIRLCVVQQRTHTVLSSSPYKSVAIVLVECGALTTACSVAMLVLYAYNFAYVLVNLGTATEIAIVSQLLVTARHGILSQGGLSPSSTAIELNTVGTVARQVVLPMKPVKPRSLYSFAEPESQDKKS